MSSSNALTRHLKMGTWGGAERLVQPANKSILTGAAGTQEPGGGVQMKPVAR